MRMNPSLSVRRARLPRCNAPPLHSPGALICAVVLELKDPNSHERLSTLNAGRVGHAQAIISTSCYCNDRHCSSPRRGEDRPLLPEGEDRSLLQ